MLRVSCGQIYHLLGVLIISTSVELALANIMKAACDSSAASSKQLALVMKAGIMVGDMWLNIPNSTAGWQFCPNTVYRALWGTFSVSAS